MIRVSGVTLRVGEATILDAVDLEFAPGTLTALVGPNGAGKSTLLGVVAGDHTPSAGVVELAGRPVRDWSSRELAVRRAVLVQDHRVRFAFTVR
ncbi:ATP-binding cassette domain-containing protein, partial [Pseudonocardia pini]|uniref:ATP-binding cassette domain-containing protein n=1 Tax=Pseudonocardia pini TaxID=2758030 RepID=UPI0015F10062